MPNATREQMYAFCDTACRAAGGQLGMAHLDWERGWYDSKRPFYQVYPSILPMLLKLDISKVPSRYLTLPNGLDRLYISLPQGNKLNSGEDIQGILVGHVATSAGSGILIASFDGTYTDAKMPMLDFWVTDTGDEPIQAVVDRLKMLGETQVTTGIRDKVLALVATLCMIDENSGVLNPLLLSKDEQIKQTLTPEQIKTRLAKAKKRGRFGWTVGKDLETTPHVRRPHPAIYHTGKGRKTPKVIFRSGAVVHRDKVAKIPTGYLDQPHASQSAQKSKRMTPKMIVSEAINAYGPLSRMRLHSALVEQLGISLKKAREALQSLLDSCPEYYEIDGGYITNEDPT